MATRGWVFTLNNPEDHDVPRRWAPCQYAVWQLEQGANGTPHLQGYVYLKKRSRLSALKAMCKHAHWEPRKGTHEQAKEYSTKDETRVAGPWEIGEGPNPGKRNDLAKVQQAIEAGATMTELFKDHFGTAVRYTRGLTTAVQLLGTRKREGPVDVVTYYGPSGTGKTRRAAYEAGADAYWLCPPNSHGGAIWWDGYDGQTTVVIDEYEGWIEFRAFLRIIDRYQVMVQTKGGNVPLLATRFIITSNKHYDEWHPRQTDTGPLRRRIEGGKLEYMGPPFYTAQRPWKEPAEPSMLLCEEDMPPASVELWEGLDEAVLPDVDAVERVDLASLDWDAEDMMECNDDADADNEMAALRYELFTDSQRALWGVQPPPPRHAEVERGSWDETTQW